MFWLAKLAGAKEMSPVFVTLTMFFFHVDMQNNLPPLLPSMALCTQKSYSWVTICRRNFRACLYCSVKTCGWPVPLTPAFRAWAKGLFNCGADARAGAWVLRFCKRGGSQSSSYSTSLNIYTTIKRSLSLEPQLAGMGQWQVFNFSEYIPSVSKASLVAEAFDQDSRTLGSVLWLCHSLHV